MIKMLEEKLHLLVRECDIELTESLLPECERMYSEILLEKTGRDEYACELHVIKD